MDCQADYLKIQTLLERSEGDSERFVASLRQERVPHLSYSQVTSVEFCERRYYLEHVLHLEPFPMPEYFTKGKRLHQAIATYYISRAGGIDYARDRALEYLCEEGESTSQRQLEIALSVHFANSWDHCQVLAVELPFVMRLAPGLPACVGVIDLVLQHDGRVILVDHKTGRDFYPYDELQMAIYAEFIREQLSSLPCEFYYDHYRWVNNLGRIRKPAFQRTKVKIDGLDWPSALERISVAAEKMEKIHRTGRSQRDGPCFMCPMRGPCWGSYGGA